MLCSKKVLYVAAGLGALAGALWLHHWALHGYPWLDQNDVQSHEFFMGLFLALAVGLVLGGMAA